MSAELIPCPFPWCEDGIIPQDDGSSRKCTRCGGRGEVEYDDAWFYIGDHPVYLRDEVSSHWKPHSTATGPTLVDLERKEWESRRLERA